MAFKNRLVRDLPIGVITLLLILPALFGKAKAATQKPITGTFLMFDFAYSTPEGWFPYFDEIAELGMDTVVIAGVGGVENCPDYLVISPVLNDGTLRRFLEAAINKGFSVYVGLAWTEDCVDNDKVIGVSIEFAERIKNLSIRMGWGWEGNFIKGFYIPPEIPIYMLGGADKWVERVDLYKRLSHELKLKYPGKSVMISPYKYEWNTYQTIYNDISEAIRELDIDIYAPQDGVGAGLVTSFNKDKEHFRAFADAVRDSNIAYGKSVKAWANVETFSPSQDGNLTWPPTDINTLSWQIDATEGFVDKRITWIYQWSMAGIPLPNIPQYSNYTSQRAQLRKDYLDKYISSPPKPGDANGDRKVDGQDYIIWLNHYNQTTPNGPPDGDFNGDAKVDGLDYVIWLNNYVG